MTDQKTGTYSVQNTARGPRTVNRADGSQLNVNPGATVENVEMTDAEVKFTEKRKDLVLTKTKGGKAAAPKADAPPPPPPPQEGENEAGVVAYVGHEAFGRYYGFNADGVKVEGVGPFKEDEGKTWATENKVDFRAAGTTE